MLNETLIKNLKEMNKNAGVRMGYHDGQPLLLVASKFFDHDIIWLVCSDDLDDAESPEIKFAMEVTNEALIKLLSSMNPKAEVRMGSYDGPPVLFAVSCVDDDSVVWLECEDNIDLGEELSARYANAVEEQMDELDFFMDLLEIGITVDTVRKYMDDEHADHMQEFCKEHGLLDEEPVSRVDAIKAYKKRKDEEDARKEKEKMDRIEALKYEIHKLQPRIAELINVANACMENGIEINSFGKTSSPHEGKATFVTNSISHRVGFAWDGNPREYRDGLRKVEMMGINAGGVCGCWDFRTNGKNTISVNESNLKRCEEPKIEHMEQFLRGFDEFEERFYDYVDSIVKN